jgi:hypothetical protein
MSRATRPKGVASERRRIRRKIRRQRSSPALFLKFEVELSYIGFSNILHSPLTETLELYYNSYRLCDVLLFQELNVVLR